MDDHKNTYCRFCAEPKLTEKMLNLQDGNKLDKDKINFLSIMYVDLLNVNNNLPTTVCFVCYETFSKAYNFFEKLKKAQLTLTNLLNGEKVESDDDDQMTNFEDYKDSSDTVKEETGHERPSTFLKTDHNAENEIQIKREPKDEVEAIVSERSETETLHVQDILDAALCKIPHTNVMLYAKEVKDICKRTISAWKEYPWLCAECNIEFLDVITLRLHSKTTHNKCSAFVCIDCDHFSGGDFETFIQHVKMHRKRLRKRCHYCDQSMSEESLTSHLKQHFTTDQVLCSMCGEILENNDALQKHLEEYSSMKPKRKPRRKRGTPLTIEDLTCKLCNKVYKNPNSLRDHMKIHTNDRKRTYACDRCGKMFYSKGTLTSHIMAHDQIRPHICRICNKSFLFPNMLRRHVDMHSGVKPFSCEQCGRCFRLQYQLNAHKIVHTDLMPHVCQYCNKAFRFKQILKNHERQHTGARPYSCQNCGLKFTNWSNFNKHMKRRHNLDTSKKKITPEGVFPINPQTGELVQYNDAGTEEWKTKIMIPGKRGKKKVIKKEEA